MDSPGVHIGVPIRTDSHNFPLRVAGYAADTAVYLGPPSQVGPALRTLRCFGDVSGLILNEVKTTAISLQETGLPATTPWAWQMKLLKPWASCRYLGNQVGSTASAGDNWELAESQLRLRLRLASHKTLTIEQRSRITSAIILLKLMYVGRHSWQDTATVKRVNGLIQNYIWHGFFGAIEGLRHTWLAQAVAKMSRTKFVLGVSDIRAELLVMAAVTVTSGVMLLPSTSGQLQICFSP